MPLRKPMSIGLALMIGLVSGFAFFKLGLPLPWMLGPLICNTIVALAGLPVAAPKRLRPYVIPIIGVMLGASVTSEVLGQLVQWSMAAAIMAVFLAVAATVSFVLYRRVGGYDRVTAFFSAMPGGLNDMILIGGSWGGDERKIALAHASRVLMTIVIVGLVFGLVFGVRSNSGAATNWIAVDALSASDWAILIGCAAIGSPLGKMLRLPTGILLGPMLLSAIAHITHAVEIAPPSLLVVAAQIVLGSNIGCQFVGSKLLDIARDLVLGLGSCVSMLLCATAFTLASATLIEAPLPNVFLAFSPGGLTEMSLLALAMHLDVAFVSVMHILRILLVVAAAPLVFRFTGSR